MCCDWKAGSESSKARKNWKAGAASEQELKLQVRRQRFLFTIAWKLLQKDRTAANSHDDVIETQTRNSVCSQIVHATPMSRHASTHHGI